MRRKIRVLFDANPLVGQKTGIGFYTKGVVEALAEIPELELNGHYFRGRGIAPDLPHRPNLNFSSNPWWSGQLVKALRKLGIRLPWELFVGRRADVLFFPDFTTWPSLFRTPKILTIHDLTFIDHPEYVQRKNLRYLRRYVEHDAKRASLILTISEFSKQRITKALGIASQKVLVKPIPPPAPITPKQPAGQPTGYILYVGTIEPRKNVKHLVEAYMLLPEETRSKHRLVLAGGQGWDSDDTIDYVKGLESKGENIVMTGYVSDEVRAALYKDSVLVAVPSVYEGFGMPILEAMSYKTPVAVSDIAVFKEVADDAAIYFDPSSPLSIKAALLKLLDNPNLRKSQVQKGSEQLKKYSWSDVANDLYQEIRKLAGADNE